MQKDRSRGELAAMARYQIERWRLAHSDARGPGPVVAMSRQHGTYGAEVGLALARRLRYSHWGQRLLGGIAASEAACDAVISALRSGQPELVAADVFDGGQGQSFSIDGLIRVVNAIAEPGRVVFVGRGVAHITPRARTLAVHVVAPLSWRIRRLADAADRPERVIARSIERVDSERQAFVERHFGASFLDPACYDLVINAELLSVGGAADVAVAALHARFGEQA